MFRLLVLLAMFIAPTLSEEEPTPEIPIVEVTEIPTEEPIVEPTPEPVIEEPAPIPYEIPTIEGCTDKRAVNYIASHENLKVISDGSCVYMEGCTDPKAVNYFDFDGYVKSDGSCYYMTCTQDDYGIESCDISYSKSQGKKSEDKPKVLPTEEVIEPVTIFDDEFALFAVIE